MMLSSRLCATYVTTIYFLSSKAQHLFHGTSVVVYPNPVSSWPGNSTFVAANFYCYFTPVGYLSFGWWLPATPGANHSHCKPSPSSYDWYEYTCTSTCNGHGCRTHIVNFNASNPGVPSFEEDYVLAALDLGNGKLGELGLSYFDKPGGGYAVGTRRTLSDSDSDVETSEACHDAFTTLSRIRDDRRLALPFEMANICPLPSIPQIRQNLQAPSQRILRI